MSTIQLRQLPLERVHLVEEKDYGRAKELPLVVNALEQQNISIEKSNKSSRNGDVARYCEFRSQ